MWIDKYDLIEFCVELLEQRCTSTFELFDLLVQKLNLNENDAEEIIKEAFNLCNH